MFRLRELARVLARTHGDHVQVDTEEPLGVLRPEAGGDRRAPVAALRPEAVVAESRHQPSPHVGDVLDGPAVACRLAAEPVAGQRRADHVHGVGGVAAVGAWIAERFDHVEELDDGAGPTVREHNRNGVRFR